MGFRWFVEREAHMLGIAGWVRNNHDGGVEILALEIAVEGVGEQHDLARRREHRQPVKPLALERPARAESRASRLCPRDRGR